MRNFLKNFTLGVIVVLAALACAGGASARQQVVSFDEVQGKVWMLVEVKTDAGSIMIKRLEPADGSDTYTLQADAEQISGKAAPNRYRAPYTLGEEQAISFQPIAGTLMISIGNPEGLTEREYYDYLEGVYRWTVSGGVLELHTRTQDGAEAVLIFSIEAH
ncbi:MAG: META domain-containing protein [Treponema sp.]|jgi:heat shock protein HslJ|nr:META domain-containing protein [Treponema sp.]